MDVPRCPFCAAPNQRGIIGDDEDCKPHIWDVVESKYRKEELKGGKCGRRDRSKKNRVRV